MIISRTPLRISFFGGGTDYPAWYRKHGGAVLAATIDKYCYLSVRHLPPFFEHRFRILYSRNETCNEVSEIKHPSVRAVLEYLGATDRGLEIHHDGDLPARSGMGTSSAFTVGLLNAIYALKGRIPNKKQLALEGIHVEQELLNEAVGSQDQVSAAYGGFNHISFFPNGEIQVKPMTLSRERMNDLSSHLMLFYTGLVRTAANVADTYIGEIDKKWRQLRVLASMVEEGIGLVESGNLDDFGRLLHEAWEAKRSLSAAVSSSTIDEIYLEARSAGALGGKITGAGGGGFMLLFVPPEKQPAVRARLKKLVHVPFRFEYSGSSVIFFDPEADYADAERERAAQVVTPFREITIAPTPKESESARSQNDSTAEALVVPASPVPVSEKTERKRR